MQNKDYIQANKKMWEETAVVHARSCFPQLKEKFSDPSFICLDEIETALLNNIEIKNKNVAHLCCNNGQELISIKRMGAGRCVGFDISKGAIKQARELSKVADADVDFIQTDVYALDSKYSQQFDLIYISVGALGWLPDLNEFFNKCSDLLNGTGTIFIYEMHPMLNMYEPLSEGKIIESYFNPGPFRDEAEPDYLDPTTIVESEAYWFHHKLSNILTSLIECKFSITHFKEYSHDISMIHEKTANSKNPPPMSYTIVASL